MERKHPAAGITVNDGSGSVHWEIYGQAMRLLGYDSILQIHLLSLDGIP